MTGISHRYCTVLHCTALYCTVMYCIAQNVDYSYTFELPETDETGDHGFLLPPSNIVKVGPDIMYVMLSCYLMICCRWANNCWQLSSPWPEN